MQIAQDTVVLVNYTLRNDAGDILDSSVGGEPLSYIHGTGGLVAGFERAVEGKKAGDKLSFDVAPAEGYGVHEAGLVQEVPRGAFEGVDKLEAGMQFHAQSNQGLRTVTITKIDGDKVTVDGNHPLAGQTLHFEVEVVEVRAATEEELSHGHAHGPGGHHH